MKLRFFASAALLSALPGAVAKVSISYQVIISISIKTSDDTHHHILHNIQHRNTMPSPSLSIGNLMGTVAILLEEVEISPIGVVSNSSSGIWITPF